MKLGGLFGKSKNKEPAAEVNSEEIAEELLQAVEDAPPARHNAPIQELTLDAEVGSEETQDILPFEETAEEEGEAVKLVEVQVNPEDIPAPPPPEVAKEPVNKSEDAFDISTTITNVFNDIEDDENPLANLIKSLPDVAATELLDDLKEINDIIKDWQKK